VISIKFPTNFVILTDTVYGRIYIVSGLEDISEDNYIYCSLDMT